MSEAEPPPSNVPPADEPSSDDRVTIVICLLCEELIAASEGCCDSRPDLSTAVLNLVHPRCLYEYQLLKLAMGDRD